MITKIGIYLPKYPEHYIRPNKLIKKMFHLKRNHSMIPKFLNFELYVALFFLLLGPFYALLYLCTNDTKVVGIIILVHSCLIICNTIYSSILSENTVTQVIH